MKEQRHQSVLDRQLSKFECLWQRFRGGCSNNNSGCSKIQYQNQGEITSLINNTAEPDITVETTATETNYRTTTDANYTATTTVTSATSTADTATTNEYVNKWVRNLSGTPLTEAQVSLLVHGPNFNVALRHPPIGTTSLQ